MQPRSDATASWRGANGVRSRSGTRSLPRQGRSLDLPARSPDGVGLDRPASGPDSRVLQPHARIRPIQRQCIPPSLLDTPIKVRLAVNGNQLQPPPFSPSLKECHPFTRERHACYLHG
ncbi:protein of unknown function [Modestobacter italicus]|uniref:Uncharacterized protein n=1 Tax=Modestobacter italicus (strain DSM 44449 / CECT 9708 / BC 501) TaxID=2732864 RepID=I4ES84_MODI5|nr:protein of unknown function [Modestobacter marinus]